MGSMGVAREQFAIAAPALCGTLASVGCGVAIGRWTAHLGTSRHPPICRTAPQNVSAKTLAELPRDVPLPTDKLSLSVAPGTTPVVVVACGSFSPPTLLHLRIFEDAKVHLNRSGKYTVVGGYLSPVHIAYGKRSLGDNHHRVNLVQAAVRDSTWLMADAWECCQSGWTRTALVLDGVRQRLSGFQVAGAAAPIKVMYICGGDLLESFTVIKDDGQPLWAPEDQRLILQRNGVVCLEREGTNLQALIADCDVLRNNESNIEVVQPAVENNISSSAVRKQMNGGSIKYLVPDAVAEYISEHQLYQP